MQVMIAEDSGLLRAMLADLLTRHGIEVTGGADTKDAILTLVDLAPPDVVVLDIRLPPRYSDEGLQAAEVIRERHPEVGLLVLSHYAETSYAIRLLQNSSHGLGYLVKDRVQDTAGLIDAIRRVANGEIVIDPEVVQRVMNRRRTIDPLESLSAAERTVLELIAEGRSNGAIAARLHYAEKTVEKRVTAINTKLGLPHPEDSGRSDVNVRVLAVLTYLRGIGSGPF